MPVSVAPSTVAPRPGVGDLVTFADPAPGVQFETVVPPQTAWRVWGGSFVLSTSPTVANRTPGLFIGMGAVPIYIASLAVNVTASEVVNVAYYQQTFYHSSRNTFAEKWFPVGIRAIWLPPGTTIRYRVANIQAGDQVAAVSLLVEQAML